MKRPSTYNLGTYGQGTDRDVLVALHTDALGSIGLGDGGVVVRKACDRYVVQLAKHVAKVEVEGRV